MGNALYELMNSKPVKNSLIASSIPGGLARARIDQATPLNMRGLLDAATNIPVVGDALSGGLAVYDAVKGDYPSASMNALGVLPFVSGTFIGKSAKTWDAVKAAEAEKRLAAGDDVRKVWKETGTFKGPDGHLRQEIDDSSAFLNFNPEYFGKKGASGKTSQLYDHPGLYKAYPESADTITRIRFDAGNKGGSYGSDGINVNVSNPLDGESVLHHELQHAIQQREGWARGGSPEQMARELPNEQAINDAKVMKALIARGTPVDEAPQAFLNMLGRDSHPEARHLLGENNLFNPNEAYKRLAGEAEARATQARMSMNMDQRLNTYPLDSYDVPVDQLIIRKK